MTPQELREIGQLRPNNHDLWKYLQRRVLDPVPVAAIAAELGLDVDALVSWMLAYRGPKRKPYEIKNGPSNRVVSVRRPEVVAATPSVVPTAAVPSMRIAITDSERLRRSQDRAKYAIWRRARDGARFAREQGQ